jgi:hypothetical protein
VSGLLIAAPWLLGAKGLEPTSFWDAAGVVAVLGMIWAIIAWLSRVGWPTRIRWAHAYGMDGASPPATLVLNTRVRNRRKQDEQLLHYYVALVPWTQRVIPGWRLKQLLDEVELSPYGAYQVPPTIKAGTGTTTWCRVTDADLLLRKRRRFLVWGQEGYHYRRFLVVGEDTWHVRRRARLVVGFDGRKATHRVRRKPGVPAIPPP